MCVHSDWRDWFILALKRTEQKERKKPRRIELKKQQQKKHKLFRLQYSFNMEISNTQNNEHCSIQETLTHFSCRYKFSLLVLFV